jgi:hypothetical protein
MVNNCTKINNTNNHLSPSLTEHKLLVDEMMMMPALSYFDGRQWLDTLHTSAKDTAVVPLLPCIKSYLSYHVSSRISPTMYQIVSLLPCIKSYLSYHVSSRCNLAQREISSSHIMARTIRKRKLKQWWSTIAPKLTIRTITSHLPSLNVSSRISPTTYQIVFLLPRNKS